MYAIPFPLSLRFERKSNLTSFRYPRAGKTFSGNVMVTKGVVALFSNSNPINLGPPGTAGKISPPTTGRPLSKTQSLSKGSTITACALMKWAESLEPKGLPELVFTRPSGGVLSSRLGNATSVLASMISATVMGVSFNGGPLIKKKKRRSQIEIIELILGGNLAC